MADHWVRKSGIRLERRRLSRNGNPRFWARFSDGTTFATQTDGSVGYEIENPEFRGDVDILLNRAGQIIAIRTAEEADR